MSDRRQHPRGKSLPTVPTGGEESSVRPSDTGEALREIITRQDSEISYLRTALDKSQALQLAALGEAAAMRARVDALEHQNRALLEGKEKPEFGDSTNPGVSTPAEGEQTSQDKPQASQPGDSDSVSLPWWKRLFGAGR